jgi:hypothetical protein
MNAVFPNGFIAGSNEVLLYIPGSGNRTRPHRENGDQ